MAAHVQCIYVILAVCSCFLRTTGWNVDRAKHIFKSKSAIAHPPLLSNPPSRPHVYRTWRQENLESAIVAVEAGGMSIRRAAELHGIPRSTLHDHVSGRIHLNAKPGPSPYLSLEEEEELVSFLVKCAKIGYPHTRQQILGIVQEIVNSRNSDVVVTNGWWERFRQRHPHITLRTAVPLSYVRAMAQDQQSIDRYYDLLEETLLENDIYDKPTHLFNCDETGIPLNPKPLKAVSEVGTKNFSYLTGSSKSQVTVLACTSAAGYALPPYVVLNRKTLNQELTRGEVPGTAYGLSSTGWMNMELFRDWFLNHFLLYIPSSRPILLLLDGHSSHYCPEMIRAAAAEGVIVFALPPNTTHLSQPLDKGAFSPLKIQWRKVIHDFITKHKGREITIYDFSKLFSEAWSQSMTLKNVAAGFKVTGVFPFNRRAITLPDEKFETFRPAALIKSSGVKFVPLYSPSSLTRDTSRMISCSPDKTDVAYLSDSLLTPSKSLLSPFHSTPAVGLKATSPEIPADISYCSTHCGSFTIDRSELERSYSENDLHSQELACFLPVQRARSLHKFLQTPQAPKKKLKKGKSSGLVLTSRENLLLMEEREKERQQKIQMKEDKRKAREEKQRKASLLKEEKRIAREEKRQSKATKAQPKRTVHSRVTCFNNDDNNDRSTGTTGLPFGSRGVRLYICKINVEFLSGILILFILLVQRQRPAKKKQVLIFQWSRLVVMVTAVDLLVPQDFSLDLRLEVCMTKYLIACAL